jgi:hypothetical protein
MTSAQGFGRREEDEKLTIGIGIAVVAHDHGGFAGVGGAVAH